MSAEALDKSNDYGQIRRSQTTAEDDAAMDALELFSQADTLGSLFRVIGVMSG